MRVALLGAMVITLVSCTEGKERAESAEGSSFAALQVIPPAESTIGSAESFGSIEGVAVLDRNRLVVSDGLKMQLSLFSDGELMDQLGRRGEGPEEFRGLGRAAALESDSFLVRESRAARLILFRVVADTLERLKTLDLPVPVQDFCALDTRLFVLGRHDENLLHEVSLDGRVLNSFAPVEEGSGEVETLMRSFGVIACSEELGRVALAELSLGGLRIFSTDGQAILTDSIPNFSRTIYEGDLTGFRPRLPEVGYAHGVEGLTWFGDGLLIHLSRASRPSDRVAESRWWSEGEGWRDGLPAWPLVLGQTGQGLLYAGVEDPYPRLRAFRISADG